MFLNTSSNINATNSPTVFIQVRLNMLNCLSHHSIELYVRRVYDPTEITSFCLTNAPFRIKTTRIKSRAEKPRQPAIPGKVVPVVGCGLYRQRNGFADESSLAPNRRISTIA